MAEQPAIAIRTGDLASSIAFYRDAIMLPVIEQDPAADVAQVSLDGQPILIFGPQADLAAHVAEEHRVLRMGIWRQSADLEADHARVEGFGVKGIVLEEKPWGDREMRIPTPDGLTVTYTSPAKRTPEQELALFASIPGDFDAAVAGLSEADLDMVREEGGWSIRQIVHHTADCCVAFMWEIICGVAQPSGVYGSNWLPNDVAAAGLDYAKRGIGPAMGLIHATCAEVAQLLETRPDSRTNEITMRDGRDPNSVGQPAHLSDSVTGMLSHGLEHLHEIREIRKANAKG